MRRWVEIWEKCFSYNQKLIGSVWKHFKASRDLTTHLKCLSKQFSLIQSQVKVVVIVYPNLLRQSASTILIEYSKRSQ